MAEVSHRFVETNGIRMHIAEAGSGPLVILCHGFPESWYSWRHQITALAGAGYHVVAPDQRGYGQTDKPDAIDQYTQFHLVGDIMGLMDALGEETAVIAGHDWGAPVAWNSALLRPDRIKAVMGLSVPYNPRGSVAPTAMMKQTYGDNFFYILYFQTPGVAEHELQKDVRKTMRMLLYSASGNPPARERKPQPKSIGFLDQMMEPDQLPPWLTEADLDFFTGEFERSGFRGGLNWYRNLDRTHSLMGPWTGAKITQPSIFITGDKDLTAPIPNWQENHRKAVPNTKEIVVIPGVGHWTQQEAPQETNDAMIRFLKGL